METGFLTDATQAVPVSPAARSFWPRWLETLRRWGVESVASTLLESAGPLSLLLAQVVHLGQPFIEGTLPGGQVQALAHLLENQSEARAFAAFLREEEHR